MATVLPFIVIIIAFWFLLIRPQQKRARQAREMQSALAPGDRVMLTSGFFGVVSSIDDDGVSVDIADGVVVKVVRNAVGQVLPREDATAEDADTPATPDGGPVETGSEGSGSGSVDLDKVDLDKSATRPVETGDATGSPEPTESGATKPGSEESI